MRVLLVEDELDLSDVIKNQLIAHHYAVDTCFNGDDALSYVQSMNYDAIILDIMLPKINGFDLIKLIRDQNIDTPILVLTARSKIEDRIHGLNIGADDYLSKPFHLDELIARVRAITRRMSNLTTNQVCVANLVLDLDKACAYRDDATIPLSSKEFAMLEYMMRHTGIVLTRERIEAHVWNYDYEGGTNVIDVYIRYLRKKIDQNFEPKLIHTMRGLGYVLKEMTDDIN